VCPREKSADSSAQASNGVRRPSFLIIFNSHLLSCTHTFARRSLSRITGAIFIIGIRPVRFRKTKKKREGSGMKKITGRRLCNAQLHGVQLSTDALHLAARTRACIPMIFRVSVFVSGSEFRHASTSATAIKRIRSPVSSRLLAGQFVSRWPSCRRVEMGYRKNSDRPFASPVAGCLTVYRSREIDSRFIRVDESHLPASAIRR